MDSDASTFPNRYAGHNLLSKIRKSIRFINKYKYRCYCQKPYKLLKDFQNLHDITEFCFWQGKGWVLPLMCMMLNIACSHLCLRVAECATRIRTNMNSTTMFPTRDFLSQPKFRLVGEKVTGLVCFIFGNHNHNFIVMILYYIILGWVQSVLTSECLSLCLLVYLWNDTTELHQIFCACWLWPRIGPPLVTLWYIMYFWFCGWRLFSHNGPCGVWRVSCIFLNDNSIL